MEKIRDFFYNKNDIVVAILILALAAILIYSRINAIMDYPAIVAAENEKAQVTKTIENEEKKTGEDDKQSKKKAADGDGGKAANDKKQQTEE